MRGCCKNGGYIIINDAYLYQDAPNKADYKTYETKNDIEKGFATFGDSIFRVFDYNGKNWKEDYNADKKGIKQAILRTKDNKKKKLLSEYHQILRI